MLWVHSVIKKCENSQQRKKQKVLGFQLRLKEAPLPHTFLVLPFYAMMLTTLYHGGRSINSHIGFPSWESPLVFHVGKVVTRTGLPDLSGNLWTQGGYTCRGHPRSGTLDQSPCQTENQGQRKRTGVLPGSGRNNFSWRYSKSIIMLWPTRGYLASGRRGVQFSRDRHPRQMASCKGCSLRTTATLTAW